MAIVGHVSRYSCPKIVASPDGSKDSSDGSVLAGSVAATVVDAITVVVVAVVAVVVVTTDVSVVGGIELEEGTSIFFVVVGGAVVRDVEVGAAVVRDVEDREVVEVIAEVSIGSKLPVDSTPVVTVDAVSNVEVSISDCVPENRLSTRNTARFPILKPANDKSGVEDCAMVLLAGSGAAFP